MHPSVTLERLTLINLQVILQFPTIKLFTPGLTVIIQTLTKVKRMRARKWFGRCRTLTHALSKKLKLHSSYLESTSQKKELVEGFSELNKMKSSIEKMCLK